MFWTSRHEGSCTVHLTKGPGLLAGRHAAVLSVTRTIPRRSNMDTKAFCNSPFYCWSDRRVFQRPWPELKSDSSNKYGCATAAVPCTVVVIAAMNHWLPRSCQSKRDPPYPHSLRCGLNHKMSLLLWMNVYFCGCSTVISHVHFFFCFNPSCQKLWCVRRTWEFVSYLSSRLFRTIWDVQQPTVDSKWILCHLFFVTCCTTFRPSELSLPLCV